MHVYHFSILYIYIHTSNIYTHMLHANEVNVNPNFYAEILVNFSFLFILSQKGTNQRYIRDKPPCKSRWMWIHKDFLIFINFNCLNIDSSKTVPKFSTFNMQILIYQTQNSWIYVHECQPADYLMSAIFSFGHNRTALKSNGCMQSLLYQTQKEK